MKKSLFVGLLILVAMVCWSAMVIAGADDDHLRSYSGAAAIIAILAYFLWDD